MTNLKPFDLEAARAGSPVCTRDGRKARIVCFDKKGSEPGEFVLQTAAILECGLCVKMISGMGGGECAVCSECAEDLKIGRLRGCVVREETP